VPRLLAECGIRFVIVEPLAGARLDGACFWLGNHAPVIALSLRVDRIDHFWFVLRHELEHVLQRQGRDTALLDAELGGDRAGTGPGIPKAERRANDAAREFCVSTAALDEFIARKAPYFSEREMVRFARSLAVHPGILAGRLQPRTGPDRFHAHIARVRATLLPHAASDGWGRTHRP
jgi:HTH-type transcriptional regulator/antitoxin HigA